MYSFAQRDDMRVVDEPLYGHYLRVSGAKHPGGDDVMAATNCDGEVVIDGLLAASAAEPGANLFVKHMAHHLIELGLEFLQHCRNVFLIRDPREMLPSLTVQIPHATLVDTGETLLLIDCGLTRKEAEERLVARGVSAGEIDAILVTHEHGDHCRGVAALSSNYEIPVFLTAGTAGSPKLDGLKQSVIIRPGDRFDVGDCRIAAEPVPHDAREPVQFCLEAGAVKLGILTDLGTITPHVVQAFSDCDALVLEFNHDPGMLAEGPYPRSVKARVGGAFGHLTNQQARQFLDHAGTDKLKTLFVAHISQQNNAPELAEAALTGWPGLSYCAVIHATQETGFDWYTLDGLDSQPEFKVGMR